MKRILTTTALIVATTGFAAAQGSDMMRNTVQDYFDRSSLTVDMATLNQEQIAELYAFISSTDAAGEKRERVRAVLADEGVAVESADTYTGEGYAGMSDGGMMGFEMPRDQIEARVDSWFVSHPGYADNRADALSEEQLAEAYLAITSTDDAAERRRRIDAAIR